MRKNSTEKRPATRGAGRKSPARTTGKGQGRPAARKRSSAVEGSAKGPAEEGPARRTRKTAASFGGASTRGPRKEGATGSGTRKYSRKAEGEGAPRRTYSRKAEGEGATRRTYSRKSEGEGAPKRTYSRKAEGEGATRRTYSRKSEGEGATRRTYSRKSEGEGATRRTYSRKSEGEGAPKRTYSRKSEGEGATRRTYSRKSEGEGAPKRTYSRKAEGEGATRRTYSRKSEGEGATRRTYSRKSEGEGATRRTYSRKSEGEGAPRRTYSRRTEGEEAPKRTYSHRTEREEAQGPEQRRYSDNNESSRPARARAVSYTPKPRQPKGSGEEGVRLNKFIANSGICSRREADDFITAGLVSVNDVIITELGTKVFQKDVVKFNGERIKGEDKVYLLMNKPKDFVTTTSDPHAEKTVMNLVEGKCAERVYPVGRLDKSTTGVLLLTNDGELAEKLTHPSFEKKKIYQVFLDKNFKTTDFNKLLDGIDLEDGLIRADSLSYIDGDKSQVGIEIHSGRNRVIRRMFEALGYKVKKLDRVYFAGLTKKNLRRGQWRFLTEQEVAMLKMGSFE